MMLACESQCMERNKRINNTMKTQFIIEHLNIVPTSAKKDNSPYDNWRKKRKFKRCSLSNLELVTKSV